MQNLLLGSRSCGGRSERCTLVEHFGSGGCLGRASIRCHHCCWILSVTVESSVGYTRAAKMERTG